MTADIEPAGGTAEAFLVADESTGPSVRANDVYDARFDALSVYLDTFFGDHEGFVSVAFGVDPQVTDNGKYTTDWLRNGHSYDWPGGIYRAVEKMLNAKCDVYVCPYVLVGRKRRKGTSAEVARRHVHADIDIDHQSVDLDAVRSIPGAVAIGSGTSGNAHVYVLLAESVSLAHHEQLCRALARHLASQDLSKISDNDCLRPPGTYSYKPTVMDGGGRPPALVDWLIRPTGVRADAGQLAVLLGVELTDTTNPGVRTVGANLGPNADSSPTPEVEQVDNLAVRFPKVHAALSLITGDRSKDTMRVVAACKTGGLSLSQTRWVVSTSEDLQERLSERRDDDVARCWDRVDGGDDTSPTAEITFPTVAGDQLLDEVLAALNRYVVFPDAHSAVSVALWIVASHAVECWNTAPRLVLNSPQKRCGKSRALDLIGGMSHAPLLTVNATTPAIFRSLSSERPPTLIIDEADAIFGTKRSADQHEDLRALLNAGHQRNRPTLRCVGPNHEPTEFPTFAMVAMAGIGTMPDTITDRAINITMRRRLALEPVQHFRSRRDEPLLHEIRDQIARWAQAHAENLTNAVPDMPIEDRAADTWEPLIAVADEAGGDWPQRARAACRALVHGAEAAEEERSLDIKLLTDIRTIFAARQTGFLPSIDLLGELNDMPESPWSDFGFTTNKLARRLRHFGIAPGHNSDKSMRGYWLGFFHDAFARYIRPETSEPSELPAELDECKDGSVLTDDSKCPPDGSWNLNTSQPSPESNVPEEPRTFRTDSDGTRPAQTLGLSKSPTADGRGPSTATPW